MRVIIRSNAEAFTLDGQRVANFSRFPPETQQAKMTAAIGVFLSLGWQVEDLRDEEGKAAGEGDHAAGDL